jgi:hypothetical protein
VAQWITRLPTEQKIAGSIPAWIDIFHLFVKNVQKNFFLIYLELSEVFNVQ